VDVKVVATNRKAYHDFFIDETYEAGITLTGPEIKSVRAGRMSLRESYAVVERGEVWLLNAHIAPYDQASRENADPRRRRRLLLHRYQISKLAAKVQEKGLTLVPLRVYLRKNLAKVELAVARGKKLYDKREAIAKREAQREMERAAKPRH
jgi:SsrA-binding protein